jgi:NADH:ubiquinone oxidoreductase subunit 4 (subunit M)
MIIRYPRVYSHVSLVNKKNLIHLRYLLFINTISISIIDVINYGYDNTFKEVNTGYSFLSKTIYLDAISIISLLLTNFPCALCVSYSYYSVSTVLNLRLYLRIFSCSFLMLPGLFPVQNALIFHIPSESALIPSFSFTTTWGSRSRKIHAALQFPFHTFVSPILIIFGLLEIYFESGTSNMNEWEVKVFSPEGQTVIFIRILSGSMSKIPAIPSHVWLPEAHVEAPTVGSVLSAGIPLKISGYGILRVLYNICTFASIPEMRVSLILVVGLSTFYSALCAAVQIDLKKIIAYSSIVHTNFSFSGILMGNSIGSVGSISSTFSHGLISAGSFSCVGMLYDRFKTRNILYYGGLVQYMPILSTIFFASLISNSSFPGTCNSTGEMFVFISIFEESFSLSIIRAFGMALVMSFSINILIRVIFLQVTGLLRNYLVDSNVVETYIGLSLINLILIFGINPMLLIDLLSSKSVGL